MNIINFYIKCPYCNNTFFNEFSYSKHYYEDGRPKLLGGFYLREDRRLPIYDNNIIKCPICEKIIIIKEYYYPIFHKIEIKKSFLKNIIQKIKKLFIKS